MTTETEQQAPQPPCTIHFIDGKEFVVPDIDAWTYVPQGLFATGHFIERTRFDGDAPVERNLIIGLDRIDYMDLDYDALRQYLKIKERDNARTST